MKANVITTMVDLTVLNNKIIEYVNSFPDDPYLIMNKKTADCFSDAFIYDTNISQEYIEKSNHGYVGLYDGYKIYYDNDLEFGMIEIR